MKKLSPNKNFIEAPTEGEGATCLWKMSMDAPKYI